MLFLKTKYKNIDIPGTEQFFMGIGPNLFNGKKAEDGEILAVCIQLSTVFFKIMAEKAPSLMSEISELYSVTTNFNDAPIKSFLKGEFRKNKNLIKELVAGLVEIKPDNSVGWIQDWVNICNGLTEIPEVTDMKFIPFMYLHNKMFYLMHKHLEIDIKTSLTLVYFNSRILAWI